MSGGAGGVAEFDVFEFSGGFGDVFFVAEGISKDKFASAVGEVDGGVISGGVLVNASLDNWGVTHLIASGLEAFDEVLVVGGGVIVKGDETGLWLVISAVAGSEGEGSEDEGGDFEIVFHFLIFSLLFGLMPERDRKSKNEKEYQRSLIIIRSAELRFSVETFHQSGNYTNNNLSFDA